MSRLLLIALVCAAPIVLGTLAYVFGWSPGRPGNYGELIEPRPLALPPFAGLRGKWVLVSADAPACDERCERKLYFMRQVRRAQGKDMERIERLWVLTAPGEPRRGLLDAYEGTRLARVAASPFQPEHIYLVDPLGNLMMRFPENADPKRMIKDLGRLLKYSSIG